MLLQTVYNQSFGWGPFPSENIDYLPNLFTSGKNMIVSFGSSYGSNYAKTRLDISAYGTYASDWKFPNMSCVSSRRKLIESYADFFETIIPYVLNVNVTYNNATGVFGTTVLSTPGTFLYQPWYLASINNWLASLLYSSDEMLTDDHLVPDNNDTDGGKIIQLMHE